MVAIAARYAPCPVTCLTRSLLLQWILLGIGVQSQLRLGVALDGSELRGHAWVEVKGFPINDASDIEARYAAFDAVSLKP